MKVEQKQIWITKEASDLLDKIETRTPKYILASQIILASIKQTKK
ncbi:MAG: hypothetical protein WCI04_02515 [archaeon]